MALDPSISLNARAPDPLVGLNTLVGTASALQGLKKSQATFNADIAQRQAEARRSAAEANVAEQTQQPIIQQQQAATSSAQTAAQSAKVDLNDKQTQLAMRTLSGLYQDPDFQKGNTPGMLAKIDQAEQLAVTSGANPDHVKMLFNNVRQVAQNNPGEAKQALANYLTQAINASGQAQVLQPSGPMVDTGQIAAQINTNPLAGNPGGVVLGTMVQKQVPVGTQIFDPTKNATALVGPGGMPSYQSGPALGAPEAAAGAVKPVSEDWQSTVAQGAKASQNIGILQNIKQHAEGASVGVGAERRALLNGIAGLVGLEPGEMSKTETDVLAKNANMLALAGGEYGCGQGFGRDC